MSRKELIVIVTTGAFTLPPDCDVSASGVAIICRAENLLIASFRAVMYALLKHVWIVLPNLVSQHRLDDATRKGESRTALRLTPLTGVHRIWPAGVASGADAVFFSRRRRGSDDLSTDLAETMMGPF